jgi:hypothetical protein
MSHCTDQIDHLLRCFLQFFVCYFQGFIRQLSQIGMSHCTDQIDHLLSCFLQFFVCYFQGFIRQSFLRMGWAIVQIKFIIVIIRIIIIRRRLPLLYQGEQNVSASGVFRKSVYYLYRGERNARTNGVPIVDYDGKSVD